jgi:hypothetical protein
MRRWQVFDATTPAACMLASLASTILDNRR